MSTPYRTVYGYWFEPYVYKIDFKTSDISYYMEIDGLYTSHCNSRVGSVKK